MNTFATTTPITAVLHIPAGRVHLAATDRTDVTIDLQPANPAKTRDVKAAEQTTITFTDGVLRIDNPTKNQYLGPTGSIDVTISLPTGSHVQAHTEATELRTTGRLGNVTYDGAYHHINLAETANLHLTAADGDIQIGHLGGSADITTARGDIHINQATTGTVNLRTQSGDITITAAVSATLDAGTSHGRITNTLKNDGTPELTIHATTTSGDITARSL